MKAPTVYLEIVDCYSEPVHIKSKQSKTWNDLRQAPLFLPFAILHLPSVNKKLRVQDEYELG